MKAAGQASVELVSIMAVSLALLAIFSIVALTLIADSGRQQNFNDAEHSVQSLAAAADSVAAQGEGASKVVRVRLPEETQFGPNATYIGAPLDAPSGALRKGINIKLPSAEAFATTNVQVYGSFPSTHGTYFMRVASRGGFVEISRYLMDSETRSIRMSLSGTTARNYTFFVYRTIAQNVTANLTYQWGYPQVNLTASPASSPLSLEGSAFNVVAEPTGARGIYNSVLVLSASSSSENSTDNLYLPITIEVR